jgi:multiple sugar transport system ATP-binding protein
MADVKLERVCKRYGATSVIESLDLAIADREFVVLVGPSGCGKSTVLRMIAGLEEISDGTISIGGRVVNDLPPKERDIAMVFQNYALYPHMSVRQNLEFGLRIRKMPDAEIGRLVGEAAEILGITQLLDRRPRHLSGGERQRVAVGRAIVRKPSVFLFDEPLSNLDAKLRVQMRAEITKLQQRLETTTVYVTHDQIEAMTMGSRIAVMRGGLLQQVGSPLEVYEHPANVFVAQFIGSPPMSFFRAVIREGGATLAAGTFALPVDAGLRAIAAAHDGAKVQVGVRPEDIHAVAATPPGTSAPVGVEVEVVETLGREVVVHGRAGEDLLVANVDARHVPKLGERMELHVQLNALHLFDAQTERTLTV